MPGDPATKQEDLYFVRVKLVVNQAEKDSFHGIYSIHACVIPVPIYVYIYIK